MHDQLEIEVRNILGPAISDTYWGQRIINAAMSKGEGFTLKDFEEALDWPTCACGKMHARKPFELCDPDGKGMQPYSTELTNLGMSFYTAIDADRVADAASVLVEIESYGNALPEGD